PRASQGQPAPSGTRAGRTGVSPVAQPAGPVSWSASPLPPLSPPAWAHAAGAVLRPSHSKARTDQERGPAACPWVGPHWAVAAAPPSRATPADHPPRSAGRAGEPLSALPNAPSTTPALP